MKSKIYAELSKATDVVFVKGDDLQDFFKDLVKATADLKDPEWDKLSGEAQDWHNDAAKAINAKKDVAPFPDLEKEEEETRSRSRRRSDDEEKETVLKKGMTVTVVTSRGAEKTGKVVEADDKEIVLEIDGEEIEFSRSKLQSVVVKNDGAEEGSSRRRRAAEDDEPEEPKLAKGDRAVLTTKRGKEIAGKIVDLDDQGFLLKGDDGEEYDYEFDAIKSLLPEKAKKADAEEGSSRRRSSAAADDDKDKGDGKSTRSSNEGVSIGQRIKELIAEDYEITEEAIAKQLKKEGIAFKENTLSLNYKDCMKFIAVLKAAKKLK